MKSTKFSDKQLKPDWLRCPRCKSRRVYYVARDEAFRCQGCGNSFTADWVTRSVKEIKVTRKGR